MSDSIFDIPPDIRLLTRLEVASLLGVGLSTLDRMVAGTWAGKPPLKPKIRTKRTVRFDIGDVKAWINGEVAHERRPPGRPRKYQTANRQARAAA